tara:strand:- start:619 stop:873 length:255 start_codon:yes stop_codon:yes gene_type:complete
MDLNTLSVPRKKELNLNKEYLNIDEATAYMCMSLRGFNRLRKDWDIPSAKVPGGRIIFRRIDLKRLIEQFMNAPENMFPPYWDR